MTYKTCNVCAKEFDVWDRQEDFGFHYRVGYGSKYDGDKIDLDLCCRCFDDVFEKILPKCKINPLAEQYAE